MSVNPTKVSRAEYAKRLMKEFHNLTSMKPSYPRSNKQLADLTSVVETLRRRRGIHDEINQPGYHFQVPINILNFIQQNDFVVLLFMILSILLVR